MKLSDVKGERALDVIADIIDPIANIASDKEAMEMFSRKKLPEGKTVQEYALERVKRSAPKLLKNHKSDIIQILAAINGVDAEEYGKNLTVFQLVQDTADLLSDEAVITFFTSAQSETSSGSAQESTGAANL